MAKTLHIAGSTSTSTSTANTTQYITMIGEKTYNTTESACQVKVRTPGTYQYLGLRISANTMTSGTTLFRFRKNGANGNQVVSMPFGSTGFFEDTTNTDTVAAGDLICVQSVPGATTNTFVLYQVKSEFDTNASTTSSVTRLGAAQGAGNTGHTTASTTYFYPVECNIPTSTTVNTTESVAKYKEVESGTFKNMAFLVTANSRTASTVRFRKNGANGNQVATVTASTTGWFEDTTNTDSTVSGDDVCWSLTTGTGTAAMTINYFLVDYETTTNPGLGHLGLGNITLPSLAKNTTTGIPIAGRLTGTVATEAFTQMTVHDVYTFKSISVNVTVNSVTAASTIKLRVNGIDSALSASITASTTGTFQNLVNTVTVADGDSVGYFATIPNSGAGGAALTLNHVMAYTQIAGQSTSIDCTGTPITLTNKFITIV